MNTQATLRVSPKRVVIAGMIRSASTFSFNIAREYLETTGPVTITSDNSFPDSETETVVAHQLLKSHAPDQSVTSEIICGTAKCICTIRKPEDAIASWMTTFGFSLADSIASVRAWLTWLAQVRARILLIEYGDIDVRPVEAAAKIIFFLSGREDADLASRLGAKYDKAILKQKLDALPEGAGTTNIGFSYYDNETFFHRRHISSLVSRVAEVELPKSSIAAIRTGLAGFVNSSGELLVASGALPIGRTAAEISLD